MPDRPISVRPRSRRVAAPVALGLLAMAFASSAWAQTITNLQQLTQTLDAESRISRDVDLEITVCDASRPKVGVLILRDETGVELLHLGNFGEEILPGERIRIYGQSCLLRKREMGVEISATPVVDNDGIHYRRTQRGRGRLEAGMVPLRLEWFNSLRSFILEVTGAISNEPMRAIESSDLWHAVVNESGETNILPGLRAECYEGYWEIMPDFNILQPVRTGVATNFDLSIRTRDERVGVRYSGFLKVSRAGRYQFDLRSDDGALLFLGEPEVSVERLGMSSVPPARPSGLLGAISHLNERRWTVVEGRVSFVSQKGEGVEFDLGADRHVISVRLADAAGLDMSALLNARVRVTGIGRGVLTSEQTPVFGKVFAASTRELVFVERAHEQDEPTRPITSVAQVQSLPIEKARQALPVHIRGTVTDAKNTIYDQWISIQDDTRGIFVSLRSISNAAPAFGELWEIQGHSDAGDFAPVVVADKITRLGEGLLPAPVRPTWTELLNGSLDVQWAELHGLVTDVQSNTVALLLPEGRLEVQLDGRVESELQPFQKAVVRIRGVLYALWDADTREVRVGRVMMRNATLSVDVPAPGDPFDAVSKTPRELLLFDAQATAFRPVKVRGQIVYTDATQLFLEHDGTGLRLLPVERQDVRPGDLVEAVGYPDIARTELVLREALLRKTGEGPLPPPRTLDGSNLAQVDLDSIRVRVEGRLLGWHTEQDSLVLEMQSDGRLYLARIAPEETGRPTLRAGSRLALVGVFIGRAPNQRSRAENESFELLLNSLADITVLSRPSWWTLPRLLALVGVLLVILVFTLIWNTQLHRLVEQRTDQLQREIREREYVERKHALEAERSRIARDLHDDLGASLTEISVLASSGQLPQNSETTSPSLFQSIGAKARSLISALDVIVWAVDPEDNSLQSLADYLSGYTAEFFSHTNIDCRFKVPMSFPPITLEGRVRHDLLLAVKEALNNVVRHADATQVEFRMAMADGSLEIDIADNGKGIEDGTHNNGHGLKNLSARLEQLGGHCLVESRGEHGTTVRIRLPLSSAFANDADRADGN